MRNLRFFAVHSVGSLLMIYKQRKTLKKYSAKIVKAAKEKSKLANQPYEPWLKMSDDREPNLTIFT